MDSETLSWTVDEVRAVWRANYATHCKTLWPIGPRAIQDYNRIRGKARSLADEQTRRQVRDADAWQRFTNDRARPRLRRRPGHKLPDVF